MKYFLSILVMLLTTLPLHAEIVSRDLVGKAVNISIIEEYDEVNKLGSIQVKLCASCDEHTLTLTEETSVSFDRRKLDLTQLTAYLHANSKAYMRLQFNKYSKKVSYISLSTLNNEESR